MFLSEVQTARINTAFQVLGVRGVTVFGSSGDGGSHFSFQPFSGGQEANILNGISCRLQMPVFPTSSPYIVSVGGTMWADDVVRTPVAWEEKNVSGTGGGFSWQFDMPEYQRPVVAKYLKGTSGIPDASSFNSGGRAYPDISGVAVHGTSQSSPLVAGIFSLLIDRRLSNGLPPLGFVAPRIWKVATERPGEAFEDVTHGSTALACDNGFPAAPSWDAVTGWGRPIWSGLFDHFTSDAATAAEVSMVV